MHSTMWPNNDIFIKDQCFGYRRTELEYMQLLLSNKKRIYLLTQYML